MPELTRGHAANGDEAAITAGGDNEELDRMKEHFAEEDQVDCTSDAQCDVGF